MVISDIDGTITKSDVMGHLCAFFEKDWTQPNICEFYTNIINQGYTIVYLSSRSVT